MCLNLTGRCATALLGGAALGLFVACALGVASAQVDCEALPAGPARTDCYIGLSRIQQQKSEIAAGVAREQTDAAILRQLTGERPKTGPKTRWHRTTPDR